jgi:tetratricopeptide (TPR) repeat protein
MSSVRKKRTFSSPVAKRNRTLSFWVVRFTLIAVVSVAIVFGVVWWRDRPLVEAESSLEKGDAKYAHYLLAKYLTSHPHHQRALALQARVQVALGNPEAAIALFDQAGGSTVEDLSAWARAYLMTEQWSLAILLLERVVQREPENADALYELTACRVRLGSFEDALASAKRFARMPGHEARGHMFMGAILHDLGKSAEALEAYEAVLKHNPAADQLQVPAADFFLQYGQTLLRTGKPAEALDPLKRSAAARESPEVLYELGNAAMQLQRPEDAVVAWKRAVTLDERHLESREALARAALQQGQAEQALEWLSPIAETDLTLEAAYLRERAARVLGNEEDVKRWQGLAAKLRTKQEFNAEIENLLRDSPESFWSRVVRAHRFAEQGNWQQAELFVDVLLQEAPGEPFVIELASAIHRRRDIPPLQSLPINHQ